MGSTSTTRSIHRLSHLGISKTTKVGMHSDGGNLYLNVAAGGSKSWIFRYYRSGRQREMGLGSLSVIDISTARKEAARLREQLAAGVDPIEQRERDRADQVKEQAQAEAASKTWRWCYTTYITDVKGPELTNEKHRAQWLSTLETYTSPKLGARFIAEIDVHDVHSVLEPIWLEKNETASRVRQRMEAVLGWAKTKGYRSGDNPAAWLGLLEHMLPNPSLVQEDSHFPALPYTRAFEFMRAIAKKRGVGARALKFLILTAQRTNPIIMMEWDEIDWQHAIWMSPAEKMKRKYPHRTPLSHQAVQLLREESKFQQGRYVFQIDGEPISNGTMNMVINKGLKNYRPAFVDPHQSNRRVVPHGFRSSFRDWAAEKTDVHADVAELAIAHVKGDKTIQAYLRSDMLEKRRPLMQRWADYCLPPEKDPAEAG